MKQIKYLSFIPFLALLCLMTGCENDKDVYYPYVNVPLTTHNPVLVEGEVLHIGIGLDGVNYRVESDNEDVVTAEVVGNEILLTGSDIGSTIVRLSDDSYNRALMTVEVRKLQELTLESLPEGVEVLRLDNDGVILREMKILTGNGGYTVKSLNEGVATVAISGTTVTVTVVGDGGTTITVTDQEKESRSIDLWVPLNLDDPTPRIYWDGYRADINTAGVSSTGSYATPKDMYWYQQNGEVKDLSLIHISEPTRH